jgi:SAM-dependent methyltransferase
VDGRKPAYILDKKKSIEYLYRRFDLNRFRTNLNSILDVSCGSGVGLAHLRDTFGWKRMCGVEFDSGAIRYGNEKRGLEIHQGTIYQHPFSEGSFDIVTMDNSLEHHSMPEQALKKIKALLRPGGALLIIVPNFHGESVDSEGINYCNLNWGHWSYFTVQSLCELLDRRGFKVEQVFTGNCRNSEMAECKHAKDVCHESTGESVRKLKKHDHLFRGNFINLLARC